jgi:hypothetical protein
MPTALQALYSHLSSNLMNIKTAHILKIIAILICSWANAGAAEFFLPSGSDLQSAIDRALPGDTILLEAGGIFVGSFRLPLKDGDEYITIASSYSLPEGRPRQEDVPRLARIFTPGGGLPAFRTEASAHHYKLIGLEIAPIGPNALVYEIVSLGSTGWDQNSLDKVPHHISIDRCFIHGWPNANFKRGVGLNSAHTEIINSYITEIHSDYQDSQAIGGVNGPGPFRIINNFLEASAENIMFGGDIPAIKGLIPSNIEIRRNHLYKPLSWRPGESGYTGYRPWVKNLFEIKNGQDIIVDGNIMENNWHQTDQHGTAILLTPRTEGGEAPWVTVRRVQFTNNLIKNVGGGVLIHGRDYGMGEDQTTSDITFSNNLFEGIRNDFSIDGSRVIQMTGTRNVTFDHNTFIHQNNFLKAYEDRSSNFVFTNNVTNFGYGLWTDCGNNQRGLNCHFNSYVFVGNAIVSAPGGIFGPGNFYPDSISALSFEDPGYPGVDQSIIQSAYYGQ